MSHSPIAPRYLSIFSTVFVLTACGLKGPLYMPDQKPGAANPSVPQSSSPTTRTPNQKKQQPTQQPNTTAPDEPLSRPDPAQPQTTPPSP
jgi:predicted small lipoprotein YifL